MDFVLVAVGLVILLFSGDLLVRGAVAGGLKVGVPAILVGLTIVAFGTSAPELLVTIQAAIEGAPGVAVGNVVGSNIANILLVLGLPALLSPLNDHSYETKRNYIIMFMASIAAVILCFPAPFTWWQGAILLILLLLFLLDAYKSATKSRESHVPEEVAEADTSMPPWKILGLILIGIVGLPIGAHIVVDSSMSIAKYYGVSDEVIGLTLVALGTSLPELGATVMAAYRGRGDIAIGNVIGSNIFNILGILGVAASLGEITIPSEFFSMNFWVMLGAAAALAPFIFFPWKVNRLAGGMFVAAYLVYVISVLTGAEGAA